MLPNEVCAEHSGLVNETDNLKAEVAKQWEVIEKLQTRLPLWATGVISALTFLLGLSSAWLMHLHNIMKMARG
jgi:hypothetical protein